MKELVGVVVVFLAFSLISVAASAATTGEDAAQKYLPRLRAQLLEMGSRAEISGLTLLYEGRSPDLLRGGTMYLTTWDIKAKVNGQTFEVLNLNILVTDKNGQDKTVERLALEIARHAQTVSRGGK